MWGQSGAPGATTSASIPIFTLTTVNQTPMGTTPYVYVSFWSGVQMFYSDSTNQQVLTFWFGQSSAEATVCIDGSSQGYGGAISLTTPAEAVEAARNAGIEGSTERPRLIVNRSEPPVDDETLISTSRRTPTRRGSLRRRNLSGRDLRRVDFRGISLRGADLRGALLFDKPDDYDHAPRSLRNAAAFELSCEHFRDVKTDVAAIAVLADIVNMAEFGGKVRVIPDEKLAAVDAILNA